MDFPFFVESKRVLRVLGSIFSLFVFLTRNWNFIQIQEQNYHPKTLDYRPFQRPLNSCNHFITFPSTFPSHANMLMVRTPPEQSQITRKTTQEKIPQISSNVKTMKEVSQRPDSSVKLNYSAHLKSFGFHLYDAFNFSSFFDKNI